MPDTKPVISNADKPNIIVIVRTLNEELNAEAFCSSYLWADKVLIADGGSSDKTLQIASQFSNVEVRNFPITQEISGKVFNPQGLHVNYLIDWAKNECAADWIIFDDCDCVPNIHLKNQGRAFIQAAHISNFTAVFLYRLYLWGHDKYFPQLNALGQSLWAWRADINIRASERNAASMTVMNIPPSEERLNLENPYCLLHYSWPSEAIVKQKLDLYRVIQNRETEHPLTFAGTPAELPEYATRF